MARFFLDTPLDAEADSVTLSGREAHHALAVYRLGPGDSLTLFDGSGIEYLATVVAADRRAIQLRIDRRTTVDREPAIAITLAAGIPKGKRMSQLVRACCELGVETIIPLTTARTVVKPRSRSRDRDRDRDDAGGERWQQVAIEASKQSGRGRVTHIARPEALADTLVRVGAHDRALVAAIGCDRVAVPEALRGAARGLTRRLRLLVLIGPEGDFTGEELADIAAAGAQPVTLGDSILRVETAAVAAVSMVLACAHASADGTPLIRCE